MEDSTFTQLCCFLSGVMRRINAESLDKAEDMRFKYMSPEQRADNWSDDRETSTEKETPSWLPPSQLNSSPASPLRS